MDSLIKPGEDMQFVVLQALLAYRLMMLTDEYDDSDIPPPSPQSGDDQLRRSHVPQASTDRVMQHLGLSKIGPLCAECGQVYPCETARALDRPK